MNLPAPGTDYDRNNEAQARGTLEREDLRNLKKANVTPFTASDGSGAALSLTVAGAWYRHLGGVVDGKFSITWPVTANGATALISLTGLPPSTLASGDCAIVFWTNTGFYVGALIAASSATMNLFDWSGAALTNAQLSGKSLGIALLYEAL